MVTHYPHQIASRTAGRADAHRAEVGHSLGVWGRVRQLLCSLHDHDTLMQFRQDRIYLKCVSCGHETPGWTLTETPPTVTIRGDARRHALVRPRLVTARRIA